MYTTHPKQTASLHSLLDAELAAAEACANAATRFQDLPYANDLRRMQQEHRDAFNELSKYDGPAHAKGVYATNGLTRRLVKLVERLRSPSSALRSIRDAEEGCFRQYKNAVFEETVPVECQALVWSTLLPRFKEHRAALERFGCDEASDAETI